MNGVTLCSCACQWDDGNESVYFIQYTTTPCQSVGGKHPWSKLLYIPRRIWSLGATTNSMNEETILYTQIEKKNTAPNKSLLTTLPSQKSSSFLTVINDWFILSPALSSSLILSYFKLRFRCRKKKAVSLAVPASLRHLGTIEEE